MRLVVCALLVVTWVHAGSVQAQGVGKTGEVGLILPLSGPFGPVGRQLREAAEFAAQNANVVLRVLDSKGTPQGALAAMVELAKDPNVWTVIGPLGNHESLAAAGMAERLAIPLLVLNGSEALNRSSDWIFRPRPSSAEQVDMLLGAMAGRGLGRIAILYPDNAYGHRAAVSFAKRAPSLGIVITAVSPYDEKTTHFTQALEVLTGRRIRIQPNRRILDKRSDAQGYLTVRQESHVDFDGLFVPDMHGRVARMLPFLERAGIQDGRGGKGAAVQLLGLAGWQGAAIALAGPLAAGALYVDPFAPAATGGVAEEFYSRFLAEFGRAPVDLEAQVFDVVSFVGKSLDSLSQKELSEGPRKSLRRTYLGQRLNGVCGTLEFDRTGAPTVSWGLYRFDDDGVVTPAGD